MTSEKAPTLQYKPDFESSQKYWDAFWTHELIDRPCTVILAKKTEDAPFSPRGLQGVDDDFEVMFEPFDRHLETCVYLGDLVPGFRPGFGPDQMAGFLGAQLVISPDSPDTSWSEKIVEDWTKTLPLRFDEDNHVWKRIVEFHAQAEKRYAGKCLLYNIDSHSNVDALEALRGAQNLLFDMIDQPEVIDQAMEQIRVVYKDVFDGLNEFGNKKTLGSNSAMHLYSRGKTDYIQADFISLLNPEMFRRFVLPAIEDEARFLDNSCFHLDGPDALKHLDDLLAIDDIEAVQWLPGAGRKPGWQWPEVINRIQAAGKAAVLYGSCEEVKSFHGQYNPELLVYDVEAQSVEEGLKLLEWLKKNT